MMESGEAADVEQTVKAVEANNHGYIGNHGMTEMEQMTNAYSFLLGVISQLNRADDVIHVLTTLRDYALKGVEK